MQIAPVSGPVVLSPPTATAITPTNQAAARERAIAMLSAGAPEAANTAPSEPAEVLHAQARRSREYAQEQSQNGGQEPIDEVVDAPAPKSEVPEKALSPHFAALARKEKAFRNQVRQFQAQQEAFRAEQEKFKTSSAFDESKYIQKDRVKADPLTVLAENGVTYEELTNHILNQPNQDPATKATLSRLEAQIKAQEAKIEATNKAYSEQQQRAYDQALNQIKTEVRQLVNSDPTFETIKATGATRDVVELIQKTWDKDGVLLSVDDAAQAVEDYLVEETTKIARLKKIQERLRPAVAPQSQKQSSTNPAQQQGMKTLSNSHGVPPRQMSARERAIAAMEGRLK